MKSFSSNKISNNKIFINSSKRAKYANLCLVAENNGFVTNFQIESLRRTLRRLLKRRAQLFFRIFPFTPITKKPNDVRLGRGKGNVKY